MRMVGYEEGLQVAQRVGASRYLGMSTSHLLPIPSLYPFCDPSSLRGLQALWFPSHRAIPYFFTFGGMRRS